MHIIWIVFVITAATWALNLNFNFNRWDNFEVFTPTTIYSHQLWLLGQIPVINIHQNLGEAILGNGQSGALYLPFTIAVLILKWLGIDLQNIPNVMTLLHLPLAASGWYRLLLLWRLSPGLSAAAAFGMISSGFYLMGSSVWQHIGAEYSLFPWLIFFLHKTLTEAHPRRMAIGFAATWFLTINGAHVQQAVYIVLSLISYTLLIPGRPWGRVAWIGFWIITLSLPALSYSLLIRDESLRSGPLPREIFLEGSLELDHLWGLLTPTVSTDASYFGTSRSWFIFTGMWLPLGLISLFWHRKIPLKTLLLLTLPAILFLDFGLGGNGYVYPWTHTLPVWSSFRWPYKFTFHFLWLFTLAAALGLMQIRGNKKWIAVGLATSYALTFLLSWPDSAWLWILVFGQGLIFLGLAFSRCERLFAFTGGALTFWRL